MAKNLSASLPVRRPSTSWMFDPFATQRHQRNQTNSAKTSDPFTRARRERNPTGRWSKPSSARANHWRYALRCSLRLHLLGDESGPISSRPRPVRLRSLPAAPASRGEREETRDEERRGRGRTTGGRSSCLELEAVPPQRRARGERLPRGVNARGAPLQGWLQPRQTRRLPSTPARATVAGKWRLDPGNPKIKHTRGWASKTGPKF